MLKNLSPWRLIGASTTVDGEPRRAFMLALLDIYERYGVYIGGQLQYADLVKEWPSAGFRRGDLEAGLDDALAAGLLEFSSERSAPTLTLLSTELPAKSAGTLVVRLGHQAADRTLQLQRSRRQHVREWSGPDRRRAPDSVH